MGKNGDFEKPRCFWKRKHEKTHQKNEGKISSIPNCRLKFPKNGGIPTFFNVDIFDKKAALFSATCKIKVERDGIGLETVVREVEKTPDTTVKDDDGENANKPHYRAEKRVFPRCGVRRDWVSAAMNLGRKDVKNQ